MSLPSAQLDLIQLGFESSLTASVPTAVHSHAFRGAVLDSLDSRAGAAVLDPLAFGDATNPGHSRRQYAGSKQIRQVRKRSAAYLRVTHASHPRPMSMLETYLRTDSTLHPPFECDIDVYNLCSKPETNAVLAHTGVSVHGFLIADMLYRKLFLTSPPSPGSDGATTSTLEALDVTMRYACYEALTKVYLADSTLSLFESKTSHKPLPKTRVSMKMASDVFKAKVWASYFLVFEAVPTVFYGELVNISLPCAVTDFLVQYRTRDSDYYLDSANEYRDGELDRVLSGHQQLVLEAMESCPQSVWRRFLESLRMPADELIKLNDKHQVIGPGQVPLGRGP